VAAITFETRLDQLIGAVATAEQVTAAAHVLATLRAALERDNPRHPHGVTGVSVLWC